MKSGYSHGSTDEFGYFAQKNKVNMHDLHQLGLNHEQLTYPHLGRNFRLTDVEGRVVKELIA